MKQQILQIVNAALRSLGVTELADIPTEPQRTEAPVYRDEPILQRASALISDEHPARYRQLRRIAADPEARRHSAAWLFCKQGAFMAAFEDDFEYHGSFQRYYPTYQDMTVLQQRGYFSWRTQVRRGNVTRTELSFVFVYIYELLNQIGVDSPEEGFETLRHFWTCYRRLDDAIDPYMRRWMRDYVIYYGLDSTLLDQVAPSGTAGAVSVLLHPEQRTDPELFEALCVLSTYRLEASRLYKKHPDRVRQVVCGVYRELTTYYQKHRKHTLVEKLFGRPFSGPWQPFDPAVFWDRRKYADYSYTVSELEQYRCQAGIWSCEKLYLARDKSTPLGSILKTVDSRLRERLGDCPPIQQGNTTKVLLSVIDGQIDALLATEQAARAQAEAAAALARIQAEQAAAEAVRVRLDLDKLQDIRAAAAITRDRLIVEEEPEEQAPPAPPPADAICAAAAEPLPDAAVCAPAKAAALTGPAAGLSADALALLRHLLYGSAFVPGPGVLPSLLADAINDAFFETFADTVIIFEGDAPTLLDDYIDDLKGMVCP